VATENDLALIVEWAVAFNQEALHKSDSLDARLEAERRVRKQMMYIWELPDGQAVTMAGKTRPISQVMSISLVYTPPPYRGRGYASNCVAALSQHLLDEGWKKCSLVTDLANPVSNSIYQKIGYRPVCDFTEYLFAAQ
jgi:predicted GNAT family acetyltransferase